MLSPCRDAPNHIPKPFYRAPHPETHRETAAASRKTSVRQRKCKRERFKLARIPVTNEPSNATGYIWPSSERSLSPPPGSI